MVVGEFDSHPGHALSERSIGEETMSVSLAKNANESVYGTTNPVSLAKGVSLAKPVRLDKPFHKMVRRTWAQNAWADELKNNNLDALAIVLFADYVDAHGSSYVMVP